MSFHSRKATRIPNFDYSSTNYYFVTICAHERACIFGDAGHLNWLGMIAERELEQLTSHYHGVKIDVHCVMPNHIHAIVVIDREDMGKDIITLDKVIGLYKSGVTRMIREKRPEMQVWQRSFHDHVVRDRAPYEKIWNYVTYNPQKWEEDCFYQPSGSWERREGQDPPLQ